MRGEHRCDSVTLILSVCIHLGSFSFLMTCLAYQSSELCIEQRVGRIRRICRHRCPLLIIHHAGRGADVSQDLSLHWGSPRALRSLALEHFACLSCNLQVGRTLRLASASTASSLAHAVKLRYLVWSPLALRRMDGQRAGFAERYGSTTSSDEPEACASVQVTVAAISARLR
jgi:hypothetical protein